MSDQTITCEILEIPEYSFKAGKNKKGRYHNSIFLVPEYGLKKWVFGCYLKINDLEKHLERGTSEKEIIEKCINFLNQPQERKKFQKRKPAPLFGNLDPLPVEYTSKEKNGERYYVVLLVTDERTNANLWGEGIQYCETRKQRNRKKREKQ